MQEQIARPSPNLSPSPDGESWAPASDNEAAAYLCDALGIDVDDLRDGRRRWRVNNRLNYYRYLARKYFASGGREFCIKRETIARSLYDDVSSVDDMNRKHTSMRRCEDDLVAAGLIELESVTGKRGHLRISLRNPSIDGYTPRSRGCSSVG